MFNTIFEEHIGSTRAFSLKDQDGMDLIEDMVDIENDQSFKWADQALKLKSQKALQAHPYYHHMC